MSAPYIPINCDFYDRLEALATERKLSEIIFINTENKTSSVSGVIVNLYIKEKVEFLALDNHTEIRLDQIISVNGHPLPVSC